MDASLELGGKKCCSSEVDAVDLSPPWGWAFATEGDDRDVEGGRVNSVLGGYAEDQSNDNAQIGDNQTNGCLEEFADEISSHRNRASDILPER